MSPAKKSRSKARRPAATGAPRAKAPGTKAADASRAKRTKRRGPATLSVDVGGSHIKASVIDPTGKLLHERVKVDTPKRPELTRARLVQLIVGLAKQLPSFSRISVGFPGVVRNGVILTAFNLGEEEFGGFNLARALERALGKKVRMENDADVQGLAVVRGKGVEMVITLGTGFGSSIFVNGILGPHLELAHHPFARGRTYEDELGEVARRRKGHAQWQKAVKLAIKTLYDLTVFDHMYIGGGNARLLDFKLPKNVSVVSNVAGIIGGVRLWARPAK